MTSLVIGMTLRLAKDVAKGADALGITHEEFGVRAVQVLLRSMFGPQKGRPVGYRPSKFSKAGQARAAKKLAARRRAKRRTVVGR